MLILQFNKEAGHVFQEFKLRVVYSMLTQSSCEASVTEDRNTDVSEVCILKLEISLLCSTDIIYQT